MRLRAATTLEPLRRWDGSSSRRTRLTESSADEELLERVGSDRDEVAFDMLHARYARAVLALVVRVLGGDPVSEDAAQDAFTAVWREAGSYHRGDGHAVDWMFSVARAAAIDAGSSRVPLALADLRNPPDDEVTAEREPFHVHHALDSLPNPERNVIELTYFRGLAPEEAAAHLDLPLENAETLRRDGLQRMAHMLGRVWGCERR